MNEADSPIVITQIARPEYGDYASVSPEFTVTSELECVPVEGGLGGILLKEREVTSTYTKYADDGGPAEWEREFDTSEWGVFLARDGETPVGGAAVAPPAKGMIVAERSVDLAVLWDIRVAATHRGRSVGSKLFQHCVEWARRRGYRHLGIETQNVNVPACRFYAKQGCELDQITRDGYPGCPEIAGEALLIWRLRL